MQKFRKYLLYATIAVLLPAAGVFIFLKNDIAAAATVNKTPALSLTSGLVGWWTFDGAELTSVTSTDKSGTGNNGTRYDGTTKGGGPTLVAGRVGQALKFDGSNDYVNIADNAGLRPGTGNFSVSLWAKLQNANQYSPLITKRQATPDYEMWGMYIADGTTGWGSGKKLSFAWLPINNNYRLYSSNSNVISDTNWHHYTAIITYGVTIALYKDGLLIPSTEQYHTTWASSVSNTDPIRIGNDNATNYANGSIDDVRIYNRALSAAEVKKLYEIGASKVNKTPALTLTSGLVGWWTFDGAELTSVTSTDKSPSANNGTRYDGTTKGGGPTPAIGRIGQGLKFDGSNDYVKISSPADQTGNVSVFAWINPSNVTVAYRGVVDFSGVSGQLWEQVGARMSIYGYAWGVPQWIDANASTVKANVWQQVGYTWNGTSLRHYVNGVDAGGNNSLSGSMYSKNIGAWIGSLGGTGRYFIGSIDDVRVYNRALSAAEVKKLYETGASKVNKTPALSLTSGLVGWWTFDGAELTSVTSTDKSGTGNNMTRYDNTTKGGTDPAAVVGRIGQALKFDGVHSRLAMIGDSTSLKPTNLTVSVWLKPKSITTSDAILGKTTNVNWNDGYGMDLYYRGTNKAGFWVNYFLSTENSSVTTNSGLTLNVWTHLVGTYNGSWVCIYVNGVQNQCKNYSTAITHSTAALEIGRMAGDAYNFDGSIDDVRIYNRALSAAEVKKLYRMGR